MPRWRDLCKPGEGPSELTSMEELKEELGCKQSIGWSQIPREWLPAVKELVAKIREKYYVEGSGIMFFEDNPPERGPGVYIEQIKDKFGTLRFYYFTVGDIEWDEIDALVDKCEERLAKDDPYYGVPY